MKESQSGISVFENMNLALVELDRSLAIIRSNRLFRDTFQLDPGAGSTTLTELIPDELLHATIRLAMESDLPPDDSEFIWPLDDSRRHFLLSFSPVPPPAETVIVSFHDVTAWRGRQKRALENDRLASLGETVAGIAHEISNPLASIMGLAQLALRQDLDPLVGRDLANILGEAKRAAEVVANLRLFSGALRPNKERTDIVQVLHKVLDSKADWFRLKGMSLTTKFGAYTLMVEGDPYQLQQVFLSIITNAQQALSERDSGGTLDIEVELAGDRIVLTFSNDGPSIDSQDIARIFDPFFTTREVGEGSGLGLSLCYRIIRDHGGSIRAESEEGRGARFIVELPTAPPGWPQELPPVEEARAGRLRILVVEDEKLVAEFLARTLDDLGHHVVTAASGEQAIARSDLDTYDLILLDMKMPGLSGTATFDHLRKLPGEVTSKVVFVTGDVANIDTQEFLQRTGSPVLAKPFLLEELTAIVQRFAVRHGGATGA